MHERNLHVGRDEFDDLLSSFIQYLKYYVYNK
jgi:hypothetical protein